MLNAGDKVLIPSDDHFYQEGRLCEKKVVYNKKYRSYTEYAGDEYLEEGDEVVTRWVVE